MRYISVQVESKGGEEGGGDDEGDGGKPPKVLATAAAGAVIIGAIAAYATSNIHVFASAAAFVVFAALSGYHLSNKELPTEVAGSTSYISAIIVLFTPFALYLSSVIFQGMGISVIGAQAQDVQGSNVSIGGDSLFQAGGFSVGQFTSGTIDSIISLVIWVVLAVIVALVLAVVGRLLKTAARRKKES